MFDKIAFEGEQRRIRQSIEREDRLPTPLRTICGLDVSFNPFDREKWIYAAAVALSYPQLEILEVATHAEQSAIPYVPGFLAFREAPPLIAALEKLQLKPDLLFVDGHGVAHPRGVGIAAHLGVLLDLPALGVAKSPLVGEPQGMLLDAVGSSTPLVWKGEEMGCVVRSKKGCLPLYLSVGHRLSLTTAAQIVLTSFSLKKRYRLPEPTRQAHLAANRARTDLGKKSTVS